MAAGVLVLVSAFVLVEALVLLWVLVLVQAVAEAFLFVCRVDMVLVTPQVQELAFVRLVASPVWLSSSVCLGCLRQRVLLPPVRWPVVSIR